MPEIVTVTLPVGVLAAEVSVTVRVQVEVSPTVSDAGEHATETEVGSAELAPTANFWTRWLEVSPTYRLPAVSAATIWRVSV